MSTNGPSSKVAYQSSLESASFKNVQKLFIEYKE